MAPPVTPARNSLKKKWLSLFGLASSGPNHNQNLRSEIKAQPSAGAVSATADQRETAVTPLPPQTATPLNPCPPATAWLLRTSAHCNNVPVISQAALNDKLQRLPWRVAVMQIVKAPPKGASAQPIEAWCSALHISGSLQSLLCTHSPSDYTTFIQALVGTSGPGLQDALVQCGQRAWQAQTDPGLPNKDGQQLDIPLTVTVPIQGLEFGLTLIMTPMLIKATKASYQPAVFIEHLVEHHEATLEQQMRYKDMLLSRAPAILTICDLQGNVLHQNAASIQYAGNRTPLLMPAGSTARPAYNYLQQALQHDLERLDELLEEIDMGCEWSAGCVKVPASLQDDRYPALMGTNGSAHPSVRSVLGCINLTGSTSAFGDPNHAGTSWGQTPLQDMMGATSSSSFLMPDLFQDGSRSLDFPRIPTLPQLPRTMYEHSTVRARHAAVAPPAADSRRQSLNLAREPSCGFKPAHSRLSVLMKGTVASSPRHGINPLMMSTSPRDGSHTQMMSTDSSIADGGQSVAWQEMATHDSYWVMMTGEPLADKPGSSTHLRAHVLDSKSAPASAGRSIGMPMPTEWHASHEPPTSWHEIKAWPTIDPATGATLVVISQVDVTERKEAEMRTTKVSEACVSLLELMFPRHVIEHLTLHTPLQPSVDSTSAKPDPSSLGDTTTLDQLATKHECVTLFFCDIVGFTTMSKEVEPVQVMQFLNSLYSAYDQLVDEFGVYKVETVGDCYVVAGGLMTQDEEGFACVDKEVGRIDGAAHALAVYRFAQAVLRVAASTPMPHNGQPVQIRIGLHSGPITSGIIGHRMPKFCLFGDSMNTCSRMETTAPYGSIHLSQATYELLVEQHAAQELVCTGGVEVKGKGLMLTYVYTPPAVPSRQLSRGAHSTTAPKRDSWKQPCLGDYAVATADASAHVEGHDHPNLFAVVHKPQGVLEQAFLLQPNKHWRSADNPQQDDAHNHQASVHVGISAGNLGNRLSRGERGPSHPTRSLRSASPSSHLMQLFSTLRHQQRVGTLKEDRESRSRSAGLLSLFPAPPSQRRNSTSLATVLSYLQLGEQHRSSSSSSRTSATQKALVHHDRGTDDSHRSGYARGGMHVSHVGRRLSAAG